MSGLKVQEIFAKKHFLLHDVPGPLHEFDLEGMQCVADVYWNTEIQGKSHLPVSLMERS